ALSVAVVLSISALIVVPSVMLALLPVMAALRSTWPNVPPVIVTVFGLGVTWVTMPLALAVAGVSIVPMAPVTPSSLAPAGMPVPVIVAPMSALVNAPAVAVTVVLPLVVVTVTLCAASLLLSVMLVRAAGAMNVIERLDEFAPTTSTLFSAQS